MRICREREKGKVEGKMNFLNFLPVVSLSGASGRMINDDDGWGGEVRSKNFYPPLAKSWDVWR